MSVGPQRKGCYIKRCPRTAEPGSDLCIPHQEEYEVTHFVRPKPTGVFQHRIFMAQNGNQAPRDIRSNNKNKRRAKNRVARAQRKRNR